MEEQDKRQIPDPNNTPENPPEDLPDWLQGLTAKPDESDSGEPTTDSDAGWVRENAQQDKKGLPDETEPPAISLEDTEETPTVSVIMDDSQEPLPDWLSELAEGAPPAPEPVGDATPSALSLIETARAEDEAVGSDDQATEINGGKSSEKESSFVEISGLNLGSIQEPEHDAGPGSDELPGWLHEMILPEEKPGTEPTDQEASDSPLEAAETVPPRQDAAMEDTSPTAIHREVTEPAEPDLIETPPAESEAKPQPETPTRKPEIESGDPQRGEDAGPAPAPVAAVEENKISPPPASDQAPSEDKESPFDGTATANLTFEDEGVSEVPRTLRFAKHFLDQGQVSQALEILNPYIEKSAYLNEIKFWLLEAVESDTPQPAGLWESIGDIAYCQGNYQEALDTYTKAIEQLLAAKERHETG